MPPPVTGGTRGYPPIYMITGKIAEIVNRKCERKGNNAIIAFIEKFNLAE
ncbi:hypothetical protein [Synergistes jonesii]|nr:hypothetical protein [Synergistes jonesii]